MKYLLTSSILLKYAANTVSWTRSYQSLAICQSSTNLKIKVDGISKMWPVSNTQPAYTCSKSTTVAPGKYLNLFKVNNKGNWTTSMTSQNSQENTFARVTFLMKLQADVCNFIKKETLAQMFCYEICEISKNTFFIEHLRVTASDFKNRFYTLFWCFCC